MLISIKLRICEPISIRYTQKSLIQYGKIAQPWKSTKFSKDLSMNSAKIFKNSAKNAENVRVKLRLSFPIKFFEKSHRNLPIFL